MINNSKLVNGFAKKSSNGLLYKGQEADGTDFV